MTYSYYVLYWDEVGSGPPAGVIARDPRTGDALIWSHIQQAWQYAPRTAIEFLNDYRNLDRYEPIDRETAERVALSITGTEPLPDEDDIEWIFSWKGAPPQSED
ncbi:hypothetical protein [Plantactinospora sp. GCM10030261]|uniref:hypothetical protein n=1 Tax=Plantactinospora sp. GCM10030261 TaxID=3273420 RepID=UPI00360C535A